MKFLFLMVLGILIYSANSWATSSWEQSLEASTVEYRADFQAEKGQKADEPVGFFIEKEEDELVTKVYFTDESDLRAYIYGCHEHEPGEFDCHKEDRAEYGRYQKLGNKYTAENMKNALEEALKLFTKKVGPESIIQSMKLWQAEDLIRFKIAYNKQGQKFEYMSCHFHHGDEMDCHRKSSAGPGEPEKE